MIKLCDQKAKEVRININLKDNKSNIRYRGDYVIKHKNDAISGLINEIIQYIDAVDEEQLYL